jgi:hypothetical protein
MPHGQLGARIATAIDDVVAAGHGPVRAAGAGPLDVPAMGTSMMDMPVLSVNPMLSEPQR